MTKRLISLFLALIMVVGVLPCTVFAVEPSAVAGLPTTGDKTLTIVNDTISYAAYTVELTRDGTLYRETKILAPNASATSLTKASGTVLALVTDNAWQIPIKKDDVYEVVDVRYPSYYAATNSDITCTFSSDGVKNEGKNSFDFTCAQEPTVTVGDKAEFAEQVYMVYTDNGGKLKFYGSALKEDQIVTRDFTTNAVTVQVSPNFVGKTVTLVRETFHGWTGKLGTPKSTISFAEKHYDYNTTKNDYTCTFEDTSLGVTLPLGVTLVSNSGSKEANKNAILGSVAALKATMSNLFKPEDGFTYEDSFTDFGTNNATLKNKCNFVYAYQLATKTNLQYSCELADITMTYTIPTAKAASNTDIQLDVLNAERYAGLAGINGEWITEILLNLQEIQASEAFRNFKAANKTEQFSDYIKAYPDVLLQVVPMETLAQAIATEQMKPATITLTEVAEGNSFFEGNSYTIDPASDTDLVEPLFATFRLPENSLKDIIEAAKKSGPTAAANIGSLLDMFYLDGKKDAVKAASETDYPNLVSSTTLLKANLASDTKWLEKVNKQLQDKKYQENLKNAIVGAEDVLNDIKPDELIMDAITLLSALEGTKLPIRLGYTYNFSDVRPGKYQVSYDGPEGWSCDQVIEVCADGTIKGLETKRAAEIDLFQPINPDVALVDQRDTLDLIYHQMVGSDLYGEDIARIESSGSYTYTGDYAKVHSLAESFLKENDKPYALFSNSGVWVNHEGGLSSGVKTIEFTAVMPDGVTPMAGATYRLINRDQILELMGTLISLGRGTVEAAGDGTLSFDELVAKYKDLISGGKTGEITASYTDALVKTADNLKTLANLKLPVILEATSDAYGLVKFTMGDDASVRGLVDTADLAVNTAKDLGDKAAELIKDTIVGKINNVMETINGINENYYKPALVAKENIIKTVNRVKKTVTDVLNSIIARLKSFFSIVKRADAAELKDYKLPAIKVGGTEIDSELLDSLIRQTVDAEVFDVALELLGTIEALKKTVDDFTAIGKAVDAVTAAKNAWSNFITNGYESLKPGGGSGGDDDEKNKLDQFIDTLKQKIKDLNHTADTITETFGKLNPAINLLKGLGEQDHNVYDVANVVMDLLGMVEEDKFPNGNYILMQIAAPAGYTRSNVCYTLHVENGRTTAQRGILTPLLETNSKALEAYVASLSDVNKAKLEKFQKGADSYLDRQAKLWDAMNYFSMTRVIANGVRDSIIADVAEAVFKAMPGCFVDVDAVELEIRTALKQVDSNPTFDELLKIADKMITKSTATVGRGWTVIAAVNVVDQIPA